MLVAPQRAQGDLDGVDDAHGQAEVSFAAASAAWSFCISVVGDAGGRVDGLVAHHAAVAHDEVALAVAGDVELVGDHDDGDALVVEFLEHAHDLDGGPAVEVAGRLVGEEDRGVVDERAGDGDALLLAAGELVGIMVGAVRQADDFEAVQRPLAHFAATSGAAGRRAWAARRSPARWCGRAG